MLPFRAQWSRHSHHTQFFFHSARCKGCSDLYTCKGYPLCMYMQQCLLEPTRSRDVLDVSDVVFQEVDHIAARHITPCFRVNLCVWGRTVVYAEMWLRHQNVLNLGRFLSNTVELEVEMVHKREEFVFI